ncbi:MAG TPA: hypothetical protein VN782_00200 [Usitatibacter sp.]|nr:hypothetical protein [Usitatibacter sp.]
MKAVVFACMLCMGSIGSATGSHVLKSVDLNDPRVLDRMAAESPALYGKIEKILRQAGDQPPEQVAKWMKASFDADNARYGYLLKTSDPPKAELSFVLGDTRYRAEVALRNVRPRLIGGPFTVDRDRPKLVPLHPARNQP